LAKKSNSSLTSYIVKALMWEEEKNKSSSERECSNEIQWSNNGSQWKKDSNHVDVFRRTQNEQP